MKAGFYIVCHQKYSKSTVWEHLPFWTAKDAEEYIEDCVKNYGYDSQDLRVQFFPNDEVQNL